MANTLKFGNGEWAIKEGSALAYNDENNNFKPLPFDFTRASTATYVAKDGLIKTAAINEPRIDFLDSTEGSLKIEPQSTNTVTYSEDFSNAYWIKNNTNVTVNAATAPDGNVTADFVYQNTANSQHAIFHRGSVTNGLNYILSYFVEYNGTQWVQLAGSTGFSLTDYVNFDILNGVVGTVNGSPIDYGIEDYGNGRYRIYLVQAAKSTTTAAIFPLSLLQGDTASRIPTFTGDGTSGVYLWGANCIQASYITSYIPTSGATATRTQDTSQTTSSNIEAAINGQEGVLFIDFDRLGLDFEDSWMGLYNGAVSSNFRVAILYRKDRIIGYVRVNGSWQAIMQYYGTWTMPRIKVALKYKANDFALWVNGVEGATDTSGSTFGTGVLDTINLGDYLTSSNPKFNSKINALAVYDTALTDSELETLTTL